MRESISPNSSGGSWIAARHSKPSLMSWGWGREVGRNGETVRLETNAAEVAQIVTCVTTSELNAYPRHLAEVHAAPSTAEVAEAVGHQRPTAQIQEYATHLAEVHAAPSTAWPALVKAMLAGKWTVRQTQQAVADELGMGRGDISNYAALKKIAIEAWNVVATTSRNPVAKGGKDGVATIATDVAFTEGGLRVILPLTARQQLDLVSRLASGGGFSKKQFKATGRSTQSTK